MKRQNIHSYNAYGETKTWKRGSLFVIADRGRVVKDDPGDDTPALVWVVDRNGNFLYCSTFWCANEEGTIDDQYELSDSQRKWLESIQNPLEKFLFR